MARSINSIIEEVQEAEKAHFHRAPTNPNFCEVKGCSSGKTQHIDADERTFGLCRNHYEDVRDFFLFNESSGRKGWKITS